MDSTQALIARLEAADEGSREMDSAVGAALKIVPEFDPTRFRDGCMFDFEPAEDGSVRIYAQAPDAEKPQYVHRRPCPHYTTSLDAKLPGENIIGTSFVSAAPAARWIADHEEPDGMMFRGMGRTEAIARRTARLKAQARQTAPVPPEDAAHG